MNEKRILAVFQPQAWINDNATDIDGRVEVDVTTRVLGLSLERLQSLQDGRDSTDDLVYGTSAASEHNGPFTVTVVNNVCDFFEVTALADISAEMLRSVHQEYLEKESDLTTKVADCTRPSVARERPDCRLCRYIATVFPGGLRCAKKGDKCIDGSQFKQTSIKPLWQSTKRKR